MNPVLGWALAAAAVVVGGVAFGWRGIVFAVSLVVFWLLMQFTRALRAMKQAGNAPVGHVGSAVMLQSTLRQGMTLLQVIQLTRSLGERRSAEGVEPEQWRWTDDGGVAVTLTLERGRLTRWGLARPDATPLEAPPKEPAT